MGAAHPPDVYFLKACALFFVKIVDFHVPLIADGDAPLYLIKDKKYMKMNVFPKDTPANTLQFNLKLKCANLSITTNYYCNRITLWGEAHVLL